MTIFYRPPACGMISFAGEPVVWLTGAFAEGPESKLGVTDMLGDKRITKIDARIRAGVSDISCRR